jgi:hypothetical protein
MRLIKSLCLASLRGTRGRFPQHGAPEQFEQGDSCHSSCLITRSTDDDIFPFNLFNSPVIRKIYPGIRLL